MIRRFFSQAWLYYKGRKAAFHTAEFLASDLGYPAITMIFYCLLAAYGFRTMDLTHWVISNSFLLCTNTCIFNLGTVFLGERYNGRLRSIVVAPCSTLSLVLASGVGPILTASATVIFNLVLGSLLFGIDFSGVSFGAVLLTILCAMTSATCFGLLISVFGMISSSIHLMLNIIHYVLMLFTGAQFPVSQLPVAGQILSRLLPLTRSIQAMDLLFVHHGNPTVFTRLLLEELVMATLYVLIARLLFYGVERACCRNGNFDLF